MLRIRFARRGKKNYPTYRVVVIERQRATSGKYVEELGSYNPHTREYQLNHERFDHWKGLGASPTHSVARLFDATAGSPEGKRAKREGFVKKNKKAKEAEVKAKEEAEAKKAETTEKEAAPAAEEKNEEPVKEEEKVENKNKEDPKTEEKK